MSISRKLYVRFIRAHVRTELGRQRLKLGWFVWGYAGLLTISGLSLRKRLDLLRRFLRIDWNIPHAHYPSEITQVVRIIADRPASPGEGIIEAGCYQGGSTAKFSIVAKLLGYRLWVYDSFEGVEPMSEEQKRESYDFSREYAAPQNVVEENIARFGESAVCVLHKGWFRDTLAEGNVAGPVRVAFIDCDLAKGTEEVLMGIISSLSQDGIVFSHDYHIAPVRALLAGRTLWERLHTTAPQIRRFGSRLASLTFAPGVKTECEVL